MTNILSEIVSLLTGGIVGIAEGIGGGLQELVTNMFVQTEGETTSLTVFGGLIIVFAGVSLAIGLSRLVYNWLTSLGNN